MSDEAKHEGKRPLDRIKVELGEYLLTEHGRLTRLREAIALILTRGHHRLANGDSDLELIERLEHVVGRHHRAFDVATELFQTGGRWAETLKMLGGTSSLTAEGPRRLSAYAEQLEGEVAGLRACLDTLQRATDVDGKVTGAAAHFRELATSLRRLADEAYAQSRRYDPRRTTAPADLRTLFAPAVTDAPTQPERLDLERSGSALFQGDRCAICRQYELDAAVIHRSVPPPVTDQPTQL